MSVPDELVGAWRRTGLFLRGRRMVDYMDAMWLQTPNRFVDIRIRIDPQAAVPTRGVPDFFYSELAFAGTASWEAGRMTWTHLIDVRRLPVADVSPLSWEDGIVVERGETLVDGELMPFAEEWLCMTGPGTAWNESHGDRSARVEIGTFGVELSDGRPDGSFSAVRHRRGPQGWVVTGSLELA
jgi:hypothetical protein